MFLILWWYILEARRQMHIDIFRQELFKLRDDLFDKAADGLIDFDSDAYGMVRTTINGFIRFAEDLTISRFIISAIANRNHNHQKEHIERYSKNLNAAMAKLNSYQRELVEQTYRKMHFSLAFYLVRSSLTISTIVNLMRLRRGFKKSSFRVALPYLEMPKMISRWGTLDAEVSLSESGRLA